MSNLRKAILAIDTATDICSLALLEREYVAFERISDAERNHAACLGRFAKEALSFVQKEQLSLVAVAVNEGPGSYTGLRIGAAFAKGLCFAQNLPLIALSGLRAMAWGFKQKLLDEAKHNGLPNDILLCPMLDARRMEVYRALYTYEGEEILSPTAEEMSEDSFRQEIKKKRVYFFGSGAMKCQGLFPHFQASYSDFPSLARHFQGESFQCYDQQEFADLAYWTPDYLKPYKAIKSKNKVLSKIIEQ